MANSVDLDLTAPIEQYVLGPRCLRFRGFLMRFKG